MTEKRLESDRSLEKAPSLLETIKNDFPIFRRIRKVIKDKGIKAQIINDEFIVTILLMLNYGRQNGYLTEVNFKEEEERILKRMKELGIDGYSESIISALEKEFLDEKGFDNMPDHITLVGDTRRNTIQLMEISN